MPRRSRRCGRAVGDLESSTSWRVTAGLRDARTFSTVCASCSACPDHNHTTDGASIEIPSLAGLQQFRNNVSVIVLNYQCPETTLACLDALDEARSELIKEIIVVDNGSDPDCVATLQSRGDDLVHILPSA